MKILYENLFVIYLGNFLDIIIRYTAIVYKVCSPILMTICHCVCNICIGT